MRQRQPLPRPRRRRAVEVLPTSIRLPDELARAIRDEAERTHRPIAWIVRGMLDESWRTHRFPGILFVEGRFGRRARVAGPGFDVWRIVELLEHYGNVATVCERHRTVTSLCRPLLEHQVKPYDSRAIVLGEVAPYGVPHSVFQGLQGIGFN